MNELDVECERLVKLVYYEKFGNDFEPPLSDDTLQVLVEQHADVDLYAELPESVHGQTEFQRDKRPLIRINASLSLDERRKNRLRTTLAHEWFHAVYHRSAWEIRWAHARVQTEQEVTAAPPQFPLFACSHATILEAPEDEWVEFQAGYASCAILMPATTIRAEMARMTSGELPQQQVAVERIASIFQVSTEAARWRLAHLGVLAELKGRRQLKWW
jgi:Zn-dependent peptidase ImmA (M78 family)